jgi:hypothetical protein
MPSKLPQKWIEHDVLTAFVHHEHLYSVIIDYLFFNVYFS